MEDLFKGFPFTYSNKVFTLKVPQGESQEVPEEEYGAPQNVGQWKIKKRFLKRVFELQRHVW